VVVARNLLKRIGNGERCRCRKSESN
jgi:hypothetical protein